jgi:hypothetical protein
MTLDSARILITVAVLCLLGSEPALAKRNNPPGDGGGSSNAILSFTADKTIYQTGERALLSWASAGTRFCNASGAWDGKWPTEGVYRTPPLNASGTYHLKCSSKGGGVSESLVLTVEDPAPEPVPEPASAPEPEPTPEPVSEPSVTFSTDQREVRVDELATLSWSSTDADSCQASGDWSGQKAVAGSQQIGPFDGASTFTLTCSGPGGSALAMLQIDRIGSVQLSWLAPSENVDGSSLTDLAGYRIYFGSSSRTYQDSIVVNDKSATSHEFEAKSGEYYVSMSAVDTEGNESAFSNEVLKLLP